MRRRREGSRLNGHRHDSGRRYVMGGRARLGEIGPWRAVEAAGTLCALCPSGGTGRRSGLRENLSPRGEIRGVTPVKFGEGPEQRSR